MGFSFRYILFLLLLSISSLVADAAVRVITKEELATKNGEDSPELWLGILGKVYDVTKGQQFYGKNAPYGIFTGRDGSAAFATGDFTPEGAAKSVYKDLQPRQLVGVYDWVGFYEKEDKYPFIGVLEGELYDKEGNPTELMTKIEETVQNEKAIIEEQKQERARKRAEKEAEKAKQKADEL